MTGAVTSTSSLCVYDLDWEIAAAQQALLGIWHSMVGISSQNHHQLECEKEISTEKIWDPAGIRTREPFPAGSQIFLWIFLSLTILALLHTYLLMLKIMIIMITNTIIIMIYVLLILHADISIVTACSSILALHGDWQSEENLSCIKCSLGLPIKCTGRLRLWDTEYVGVASSFYNTT